MKRIGFVGLGIMGKPMVRNLLKAGFSVTVYDIVADAVKALVAEGATGASSAKEVATDQDVVITMVPSGPIVRSLLNGDDGILAGVKAGTVIVDMSSVTPVESKEFAELAAAKGCAFLDAPVSGGEPGAVAGTLAIMVGGEEDVLDSVRDVFEAMGSSITLVGPTGSGSVTKLANQVIVNLNIAAVAEALILSTKAGADPKKVYEAIRGGLAGSTVLDAKAPMMFRRNFKPGGPIKINLKDITNVMDTAKKLDLPLVMTGVLEQIMHSLKATGHLMDDHSGIVQFYENISGVVVKTNEE
ncbi:2-hydroxy-3-oxopropionate reductase [Mitsuokella multacida]|uniref:2-hydroxy-3-oxopropionate reductase n=1 Tax=Mitsuokella multacida TaxID=52226 RepID=UPI003461491B